MNVRELITLLQTQEDDRLVVFNIWEEAHSPVVGVATGIYVEEDASFYFDEQVQADDLLEVIEEDGDTPIKALILHTRDY